MNCHCTLAQVNITLSASLNRSAMASILLARKREVKDFSNIELKNGLGGLFAKGALGAN
jgi:hypothetical protein